MDGCVFDLRANFLIGNAVCHLLIHFTVMPAHYKPDWSGKPAACGGTAVASEDLQQKAGVPVLKCRYFHF